MKLIFALSATALFLSACDVVGVSDFVDGVAADPAREAAKAVVGPIVADTVPGPAAPILTNCIIDNASSQELLTIAGQGATPENISLVSNILQRPATVNCATTALT